MREQIWKFLLFVNVVVPAAGGVVLFLFPSFVPGTVGIATGPDQYLLSYLLGGTEFAFAWLCFAGLRSDDRRIRRLIAQVAIIFHATAGVATFVAWLGGTEPAVLINTAARIVMVALFGAFGLRDRS
jgi:hypothetical protein